MLIKCPECEMQLSDKAYSCPHCGYPMKVKHFTENSTRGKSRFRLPNGFGQITKLKNRNLRRPYRAMVTVGKTEYGKPICKLLKPVSYFESYADAYAALVEYNKSPLEFDKLITVKELYDKWTNEYYPDGIPYNVSSFWPYCRLIYNMKVSDIRVSHLKTCICGEGMSSNISFRVKTILNRMFDYAVENEYITKNVARSFGLSPAIKAKAATNDTEHIAFTIEELNTLLDHMDNKIVAMIMIQCYTGWRPGELIDLKMDNVDMNELTMVGGKKTKAGINRTVPIHNDIINLAKKFYELSESRGDDKLFGNITYRQYSTGFHKVIKELGLNEAHRPHDPRKTFVTLAKNSGVSEFAIKRIVGHAINDITEQIYTERSIDWLRNEINKISIPLPQSE